MVHDWICTQKPLHEFRFFGEALFHPRRTRASKAPSLRGRFNSAAVAAFLASLKKPVTAMGETLLEANFWSYRVASHTDPLKRKWQHDRTYLNVSSA